MRLGWVTTAKRAGFLPINRYVSEMIEYSHVVPVEDKEVEHGLSNCTSFGELA